MPVLAFPGPAAPPPPTVTVEVPEGWDALPAGPDLLRARGAGANGDPVEVTVRHHTGPVGYAANDLLDSLGEASTRAGTEVEPSFVVEIGGREWVARNITWDESTGPVVEVLLASSVGAGDDGDADGVSRLVVATGRVSGGTLDADYDVLQAVLETLVVGGAA